jgi:hypothetical protein
MTKNCAFCKREIDFHAYKCTFCGQTLAEKIGNVQTRKPSIKRLRKFLDIRKYLRRHLPNINLKPAPQDIVGVVVVALCFLYAIIASPSAPCTSPIGYKIGTLDSRFGVTQDEFQRDLVQASNIWEKSINRELFKYDPNGSLVINLEYDTRQQATQEADRLNANIDETQEVAASIKEHYVSLQNQYRIAQQEYSDQLDNFNKSQDAYNDHVAYWNNEGGAPENEYSILSEEKSNLIDQQNSLEESRQQVNQLGVEINEYIDKYNLLVDHINSNVHTINNNGLVGTQFEEGVYISDKEGKRINIYQFDNNIDLVRVLAHELGHSLRLQHNANTNSIMNPLNQGQDLSLSPEDLQELKTACGLSQNQ